MPSPFLLSNVRGGGRRRSKFYESSSNAAGGAGAGQTGRQGANSIMFWLYYLISGLKFIKHKKDLNWVDRLSYHWSTVILLCCSITVTAKQYVGVPIQCWVPATFTEAMEQYAESHCWAASTYWVHMNDSVPNDHSKRRSLELSYYQWVPFLLALEAVIVCVPCIIWRALYWQTGFDLAAIVEAAAEIRVQAGEDRKRLLYLLCSYMYETCQRQRDLGHKAKRMTRRILPASYRGCYVTVLCCITKFICLMNCLAQLSLLNIFLQTRYPWFGVDILYNLANGISWEQSGLFPRVTLCDFQVRELANIHRHTIQCVLVINMFNEKIFMLLWFWFLLLTILVGYNLTGLIFYSFPENQRLAFLERYFIPKEPALSYHIKIQQLQLRRFLCDVLQYDGVLILRNIAAHAGEFVCSEVVTSLYEWHENGGLQSPTAGGGGVPTMEIHRASQVSEAPSYTSNAQPPVHGTVTAKTASVRQRPTPREFKERPAFQPGHRTLTKSFSRMSGRQRRRSDDSNASGFGFLKKRRASPTDGYLGFG